MHINLIMNQSKESQVRCQQELGAILPNIQSTLYTALFCKNKLTEPLDSLIFGFFIGFLSSKKDIKVVDSCLSDLLEIYFRCTKQTKTIENLLQLLSAELTLYLYKNNFIAINNYPQVDPIREKQPYNPNINIDDNEEIFYQKCKVCSTNFNIYDIANYGLNCGCIVHDKCFDNLVKNNINMNKPNINCPYCNKDVHTGFIVDSLMFNNPDLLAKYEKLTLEQFTNNSNDVKNCPTAGCNYIFSYKQSDTEFSCPKCNKTYCLKCKVDWHYNKTCAQHIQSMNQKNESAFIEFAQGNNYKKCPFCYTWVEKIKGTTGDQMHCKCGNDFCFNCGERYYYNHVCPCSYYPYHIGYPFYRMNRPLTKRERKELRKKKILERNY